MAKFEMGRMENVNRSASTKRGERQIISSTGLPVEITSNPDSKRHAEKITLGIGGLELLGEGDKRTRDELDAIAHQKNLLHREIMDAVIHRIHQSDPSFPENFIPDSPLSRSPVDQRYYAAEKEHLKEHPELAERRKTLNQDMDNAYRKLYAFSERGKEDVYVGKEGTLIYSEVSGEHVAEELLSARERARQYEENKLENWRARLNWGALKDQLDDDDLETFVEKLRDAKKVIDIHQIEVLPQHQGKGLAKALFDVALWDIEQVRQANASIARVLADNPDREKVLGLFEKNGYKKLYCPGSEGGMTGGIPNYYLLIKENKRS